MSIKRPASNPWQPQDSHPGISTIIGTEAMTTFAYDDEVQALLLGISYPKTLIPGLIAADCTEVSLQDNEKLVW